MKNVHRGIKFNLNACLKPYIDMNTDLLCLLCFIVYSKKDDIYEDIAEDIEIRFDTSNYELYRPFSKGKRKKGIRWENNNKVFWTKKKNLKLLNK